MNWMKNVWILGVFCLNSAVIPVGWAQLTRQVVPVDGRVAVQGSVRDAQTKTAIAAATILAKSENGIVQSQQVTQANGSYLLMLNSNQSYIFTVKAEGYITLDEQVTFTSVKTSELRRQPTFLFRTSASSVQKVLAPSSPVSTSPVAAQATKEPVASTITSTDNTRVVPPKTLDAKVIYTPPLVVAPIGKTVQLPALQFVQSQAELLPTAQPALEQLLAFMRDHPTTEIELAGHTDNQGDFDKNLQLSKQRVDVVKEYLVNKGVTASRITTRGYGPTRPIASNNREVTRQLNRRVEMTVLKQ